MPKLLGAIKHHMLKQVADARYARALIARAYIEKSLVAKNGNSGVWVESHLQPVGQRFFDNALGQLPERRRELFHSIKPF
jgi:hypothetical protein